MRIPAYFIKMVASAPSALLTASSSYDATHLFPSSPSIGGTQKQEQGSSKHQPFALIGAQPARLMSGFNDVICYSSVLAVGDAVSGNSEGSVIAVPWFGCICICICIMHIRYQLNCSIQLRRGVA
jgi:hypothetical protein